MANHTPGPWTVSPRDKCVILARLHKDAPYESTIAETFGYASHREANARLIAAAPDLLASCKDLLNCADPNRDMAEIRKARAAIRQAEGEL